MEAGPSKPRQLLHLNATETEKKIHPTVVRRRAIDALLQDGLPYSKKLVGHTSCVNALTFSPDGRWLASAGDDPCVHLWDFNQEELSKPAWTFYGPRSNVFTLAFSASGRYLYSGDTRDDIFQFDLSHLNSPVGHVGDGSNSFSWSNSQHEDSIRAISCHPEQDHLLLSAAEDGRIILHDMREHPQYSQTQRTLQHDAEFTSVQYHPTMTHIFATSDNRGQLCLRDVRMAFGPLSQRRQQGIVHKYVTTIARQGTPRMARPEVSSLVFDREGRRLAVTMLHHVPTLYGLNDPYPIATFSGKHLPNGERVLPGDRTYANCCTMKHGSFGSLGSDQDLYYVNGSDDFRTYLWKVPDEAALLEGRSVVEFSDWARNRRPGEIGYASSMTGPRYVPVDLSTPLARLTGHDSIVNTALIHPYRPYILTAGIERYIRLHSPTSSSPCTEPLELTSKAVRTVAMSSPSTREAFLRAMGVMDDPASDDDEDGDSGAIALFDHILRQEGNADVFSVHPWEPDLDEQSSDESMDIDSSSDDADDEIGGVSLY
ncbi:WD40 repeat-like protein [Polyporus arcularius HHB13444]|uniref:WD40 repeat-like protein n=1 Tax=Polyporus arcularius HHB13444 TaxID=1314778 RepID=A0A5C3PHH4_9APHY|nr:WD40 repeat-like protein [Polyporus arcularius HHB13444]